MTLLARIASPVVWLLDRSGRVLLRLLGYTPGSQVHVTEEEIRTVIAEAESAGVLEPGERQMISAVMRLGDRPVRAVMTPRPEVDMIDLSADDETIRRLLAESMHSRLPVYEGSPDEMLGIVQAKDLLEVYLRGQQPDIRAHVRAAPVIPDTADVLDVVDIIKQSPIHLGLVHDEYGHFEGVVTNADILEAIVGAFRTDEGMEEPYAVQREDGSWLISGLMAADELAERLAIPLPRAEGYHTVGGFVLDQLGRLPETGERFEAYGWRFEVVDMDGRRIDKVLVSRIAVPRRSASAR
jgi:putative hemolysin